MTTPLYRDGFDDPTVTFADSKLARAAFTEDERPKVAAFVCWHGVYRLTLTIGGTPQTLADRSLLTLFTRARRLLQLVAELPATDSQEHAA